MRVTVRDPRRKVNHLSKVIQEENHNKIHQVHQSLKKFTKVHLLPLIKGLMVENQHR